MGYNESDLVWKHSKAIRLDKFVLLAIAKTYNKGEGSYPSQTTIAKMCGIADARGVRKSLQRLSDLGELTWVRGSNNSGKANVYFITFIEQDIAKKVSIPVTKKTAINDQKDLYTSDQKDRLLNKGLNKLLNAKKLSFDSTWQGDFMKSVWSRYEGRLSVLRVVELMESFAGSYECSSAYTEDVRLTRFYALLDSAASQAERDKA
jgi:alkylated DNA nucleotide flippase Atl1